MKTPGFTAEVSLYSRGYRYYDAKKVDVTANNKGVLPQLMPILCWTVDGDIICGSDFMGGSGKPKGGGSNDGRHPGRCRPHCAPCRADPSSSTGKSHYCTYANCDGDIVEC